MNPLGPTDLDRLYAAPKAATQAKVIDHIEKHARRFLELSPFCVIGTSGPDGSQDVSPRGGAPGFVRVVDERTLMMPDRPGNNLLDSLRNLTAGGGEVGLLFLIPGFDETLRINGRASVLHDEALCADFTEFGKPARAILRIEVRELFLQCGKALMRSRMWEADAQVERSTMPSVAQIIVDQVGAEGPPREALTQEKMLARYRESL